MGIRGAQAAAQKLYQEKALPDLVGNWSSRDLRGTINGKAASSCLTVFQDAFGPDGCKLLKMTGRYRPLYIYHPALFCFQNSKRLAFRSDVIAFRNEQKAHQAPKPLGVLHRAPTVQHMARLCVPASYCRVLNINGLVLSTCTFFYSPCHYAAPARA
jgi:hypothetical protein